MLTRLLDVAAQLDRSVAPRVLAPLSRLDRAAAVRLLPVLLVLRAATAAPAGPVRALTDLVLGLSRRALQALLTRAVAAVRAAVTQSVPVLEDLHRLAEDHVLPPSARLTPPRDVPPTRTIRVRTGRGARELALCSAVVLLLGMGAASAGDSPDPAVRAVSVASQVPDRPAPGMPRQSLEISAAPAEARPATPDLPTFAAAPVVEPAPPAAPAAPAAAVPAPTPQRWLPTGTGMWLHKWHLSEGGSAPAVVARARTSGFSHLYVQTGSSHKGWIGDEVLSQLLPATAGTDLKVIAWDFPELHDPEGDAHRMARAALWHQPGVPRVAAVAPDVETNAEGTHLSPDAVTRYYTTLRAALPPEIAVLATVPWPSEKRTGLYPYAETAAYSDALVPMAYWYNRDPAVVTATSMQWLAQFGLPVMPVGQGYDGRLDAPYLPEDPDPGGSVQKFVDAARAGGARSISLWSWQTTGHPQWDTLARASAAAWPSSP